MHTQELDKRHEQMEGQKRIQQEKSKQEIARQNNQQMHEHERKGYAEQRTARAPVPQR